MMKLIHKFIEFIPKELEENTIYISIKFRTAVHNCACGCGMKTVTPFSPTDWELTFDGNSISLNPSIGNWSYPCQSHYWIKNNKVEWAPRWGKEMITLGRKENKTSKQNYYDEDLKMTRNKHQKIRKKWWKFQWLYSIFRK